MFYFPPSLPCRSAIHRNFEMLSCSAGNFLKIKISVHVIQFIYFSFFFFFFFCLFCCISCIRFVLNRLLHYSANHNVLISWIYDHFYLCSYPFAYLSIVPVFDKHNHSINVLVWFLHCIWIHIHNCPVSYKMIKR